VDKKQTAEKFGRFAETLAAWSLRIKGFRIIARGFRTPVGEIDIIARRGGLLVFIEVKARRNITDAAASPALQVHLCRTIRPLMDWMSGLM
jgi:putative endonuclease